MKSEPEVLPKIFSWYQYDFLFERMDKVWTYHLNESCERRFIK